MLDLEVGVQQERLGPRQPALALVQVAPGGLHHADRPVRKRGQEAPHELRLRDEVGVQHQEELAVSPAEAVGESAGLEARTGVPADVVDANASAAPVGRTGRRDLRRCIGGVIQDLDVEQPPGIVEPAGRVDQPLDDVGLVVDGQLDGDSGQGAGPDGPDTRSRLREPPEQRKQPMDAERHEEQKDQHVRCGGHRREHALSLAYRGGHPRLDGFGTRLLASGPDISCRSKSGSRGEDRNFAR